MASTEPLQERAKRCWYAVTRIDGAYGLFSLPLKYSDLGTLDEKRGFGQNIALAHNDFMWALSAGVVRACTASPGREPIDNFLKAIIAGKKPTGLVRYGDDICVAIIDFTRTSLPQLSGKAARDAFAMGHRLATCHFRADDLMAYLGYGANMLRYSSKEWHKPEDCGEKYYEQLRKQFPLVIYWNFGGCYAVHPDYEPKKA